MDFKDTINELAKSYVNSQNNCERRKIRNEIASILYKNQHRVYIKNHHYIDNDDKSSLISDAFISALTNFKLDKDAEFYTYFICTLQNKRKDLIAKEDKIRKHEVFESDKEENAESTISFDNFFNNRDTEDYVCTAQGPDDEVTSELTTAEIAIKHMNLIINFYKFNDGKKANKTRYDYYKMFYTDSIGNAVRSQHCVKILLPIEDKVCEAMNLNFQDFYTKEQVRSLAELKKAKYKKHCEIVTGEDTQELENPLPNDIFLEYYNQINGVTTSLPTVSQQKKAYKEYLKLLKN